MRLVISLNCKNSFSYDTKYYHKLQGFIYNLIKNSDYSYIHDKVGYKFISFSNIFPPKDAKMGDTRTIIVSSPNNNLISFFEEKLRQLIDSNINIGHMQFQIKKISLLNQRINDSEILITGTPVIVRMPKEKFLEYNTHWNPKYDYVYWRSKYPIELFIDQIEDNLRKKYYSFYREEINIRLFEDFEFRKEVCNHVIFNGQETKVFGSLWQFKFDNLTGEKKKIISFALDCGLGELNSLGFGFLNKVRSRSVD